MRNYIGLNLFEKFAIINVLLHIHLRSFPALACLSRTSKEIATFTFYKSDDDSYQLISNFIDSELSIVGCAKLKQLTYLENGSPPKLESANIQIKSLCVISYLKDNCEGGKPIVNDKIGSFHLCSWKGPLKSPSKPPGTFNPVQYNFHDEPNCQPSKSDYWLQYIDLKNCANFPEVAKNKTKSACFQQKGGCLLLYENEDCSSPAKGPITNHISNLEGYGKISSTKSCGLFLLGKITHFRVISTTEDLISKGKSDIIKTTQIVVNNYTRTLSSPYVGRQTYNETFTFQNIKSLHYLYNVEVDMSRILVEGIGGVVQGQSQSQNQLNFSICDPSKANPESCKDQSQILLNIEQVKKELRNAYQCHSRSGLHQKWTSGRSKKFTVHKWYKLKPCWEYEFDTQLHIKRDIPIEFELGIEIYGENREEAMKSEELREYLPPDMIYLKDLNKSTILAKTKGTVVANLALHLEMEKHEKKRIDSCTGHFPVPGGPVKAPLTATNETITSETSFERFPKILWGNGENSTKTVDVSIISSNMSMGIIGVTEDSNGNDTIMPLLLEYKVYLIIGTMIILSLLIFQAIVCILKWRRGPDEKPPEINFKIGKEYLFRISLI